MAAYEDGFLGDLSLPEDSAPLFVPIDDDERRLVYFTLPMALNYRRGSDQLWRAAKATYDDPDTSWVFDLAMAARADREDLTDALVRHRLAAQPRRHVDNWLAISQTISTGWGTVEELLTAADHDFVKLRELVQKRHKRGFPYLSGPKLFNYWAYVLTQRCGVGFDNADQIDIAVDTHVLKATVRLGVVTQDAAERSSGEEIGAAWREQLRGTGISPSELNVPLWAWSRSGFVRVDGVD